MPRAVKVFKSAWIPAPALQSEPATVSATGTVATLSERRLRCLPIGFDGQRPPLQTGAVPVVADRFDRAAFHRFFAETFFVRRLRLLVDVGVPAVIVSFEIGGGRFAAQIAVDALIIDVEFARYVLGVFVR